MLRGKRGRIRRASVLTSMHTALENISTQPARIPAHSLHSLMMLRRSPRSTGGSLCAGALWTSTRAGTATMKWTSPPQSPARPQSDPPRGMDVCVIRHCVPCCVFVCVFAVRCVLCTCLSVCCVPVDAKRTRESQEKSLGGREDVCCVRVLFKYAR